jgi:hypothetical protein
LHVERYATFLDPHFELGISPRTSGRVAAIDGTRLFENRCGFIAQGLFGRGAFGARE